MNKIKIKFDESTDIQDAAHIIAFIHMIIKEELLNMIERKNQKYGYLQRI